MWAGTVALTWARFLVVAFGSVAKVAGFFPTSAIFVLVLGDYACLGIFSTCPFASLAALVV